MLSIIHSLLLMTALFNAGLAIFILRDNWKTPVNVFFGIYLATLSFWALALIGTQIGPSYIFWLYSAKATYIAGLIIGASFYLFSITFPEGVKPSTKTIAVIYGLTVFYSSTLLLEPSFLTKRIVSNSWGNGAELDLLAYTVFTALFCFFYLGGLIRTWYKYFRAKGDTKIRLLIIGLGVSITGIAGLYFDIILPSPFLDQFQYIWSGPLFNTLMAVLVVYSVFRFHLFNAKVIVAEFTIALLWIFTFLRTLLASEPREQILNAGLFVLSLIIGSLFIKSVHKEVRTRELIQKQEEELEEANKRQENLLHFMSHEVKGYLTKAGSAFAMIAEGDYGAVTPQLKNLVEVALADNRRGVTTVMDILSAGNLKKGTVSFTFVPFDFKAAVEQIVKDLTPSAEEKQLKISLSVGEGDYKITGDCDQLTKHVIRNLIDNAVKYTLQGAITISLCHIGGNVRLAVKDSGVGITDEDKKRLFTEGGRGKDSIKVNTHSTGYGLFIAKQIMETHKGRIWAESAGAGKGSTFFVELPTNLPATPAATPVAASPAPSATR